MAAARAGDPDRDRHLVAWAAVAAHADLGRWLLELAGGPGDRAPLVTAAARAGLLDPADAETLAAPVLVADHPLARRECAALRLTLVPGVAPMRWDLVPDTRAGAEHDGYVTEVSMASLGATGVYETAVVHASELINSVAGACAAWETLHGGDHGTAVMCTVGPQHQTCLTWAGTDADGRLVAVVTDLGLLEPDPDVLWQARA